MSGLRVLITNNALAGRMGTEMYVRDLAEALLKLGHRPIVYSTELGIVAAEIRSATVPVVSDLSSIGAEPDIIHGQHHLETMTALLRFPGVPAVYFCHGWTPWEECPPRFPRIVHYVAVDQACRDRLVFENGIPEDRVSILLNFINLDLFPARPPLPGKPARALVFSNNASSHSHLPVVLEARAGAGLSVDCIGSGVNNVCDRPGEMIGAYDIVFAKARSALEAMAVGAAVVLCDQAGMGPMVDSRNLESLRALNFGIRALQNPVTAGALTKEIENYDPLDAARVSKKVREMANLTSAIQDIIPTYTNAIARYEDEPASSLAEEARSASEYLRWISPHIKEIKRQAAALQAALIEQSIDHSSSLSAKEKQIEELTARLELSETEVRRIKKTLGWRLLNGYGIMKHRYLLPAYGLARRSSRQSDEAK